MSFFFFNDTATTEIYTLSLHDALPISVDSPRPRWSAPAPSPGPPGRSAPAGPRAGGPALGTHPAQDRKSTRLNSSHSQISYAVFCLKKKKSKYHHGSDLCNHDGSTHVA